MVVFGLFFFIAEKGFYYFVQNAPKKEYDKRLENVIQSKMDYDLVILGSSRGANNISACQLETKTGLKSFNLSYKGSNINFHNFILETYLKFNKKPEKVILFLDHKFTFIKEPSLTYRYDRLFPLSKYNYINEVLIDKGKKNILSRYLSLSRINRADFNLEEKKTKPNDSITNCGSQLNIKSTNKVLEYSAVKESYNTLLEQEEYLQSFFNIQQKCKENKIDLTFVLSPNYHAFNTSFYRRLKKLMLPENSVIVYDTTNVVYKNKALYFDSSHLLKAGAEVFTSEISSFLNQNK